MTWSRRVGFRVLSAFALFAACSDTTPPPEPISFQRANRVAFVCVNRNLPLTSRDALVPMRECEPPADGVDRGFGLHALVLQSSRGEVAAVDVRAWRVLDSRNDIPGKTFVPAGSVPVAIAIAPDHPQVMYVANSGSREISVLRTAAAMALSVSKTDGTAERALLSSVPLRLSAADPAIEPYDIALSPDQDALFVTSRAGGSLLKIPIKRPSCPAQADAGAAEQEPCADDGMLDEAGIVRIPLEDSWAKLPPEAFMPDAAMSGAEPYRFVCREDDVPPLLDAPNTPPQLPSADADVGTPEPAGMTVDAFCAAGSCTRRLLIADAHQPIVHAVDLDQLNGDSPASAVLPPILTGAPTERVAVTPPVPVAVPEPGAMASEPEPMTQYVYAIDARDGSVVATRDGHVLNVGVDASARADRLDIGQSISTASVVAMSLAVVTPNYWADDPDAPKWVSLPDDDPHDYEPFECVDNLHQARSSERLRGVFLAVGATDGTVRIINVHDMELRDCRGGTSTDDAPQGSCVRGEAASYSPFKVGYDPQPVVRNRPRLLTYGATDLNATPVRAPTVTPNFSLKGASIGVKPDGTTNDTRVAGLDCITCPENQAVSFSPDDVSASFAKKAEDGGMPEMPADGTCGQGQGRICSMADPFVEPHNWQAVYEGPIPGTLGGRGRFIPKGNADENQTGALEFVGDIAFCDAGVLGDDLLPTGDKLVITSPLPTDALRAQLDGQQLEPDERDVCNKLVDARTSTDTLIAFGIRRAFADRVQVTPELISPRAAKADWVLVLKCFAGLPLTFQVHARDSFVVRDLGVLGFQHRVIADPDTKRCVIDESKSPKRTGRARKGELYDNGLISFQARADTFSPFTVLTLGSVANSPKMLVRVADPTGTTGWQGVMPVDLRYSPTDQQLYIVDSTVRGLMRVTLDPVRPSVAAIDTIQ